MLPRRSRLLIQGLVSETLLFDPRREWKIERGMGRKEGKKKRTVGVHDVQRAAHGPHHHARDFEGEKHVRHEPPVPPHILRRDPEPVKPHAPKHQLRGDQHDAELRFIDPFVLSNHEFCGPVRQQAGDDEADDGADERTGVLFRKEESPQSELFLPFHDGERHGGGVFLTM